MTENSKNILASIDTQTLVKRLIEYEIRLQQHVTHEQLYTADGELNLRNPYGAILYHARNLRSVLSNFDFKGV